jgi:hypothetical protein
LLGWPLSRSKGEHHWWDGSRRHGSPLSLNIENEGPRQIRIGRKSGPSIPGCCLAFRSRLGDGPLVLAPLS